MRTKMYGYYSKSTEQFHFSQKDTYNTAGPENKEKNMNMGEQKRLWSSLMTSDYSYFSNAQATLFNIEIFTTW